MDKTNGELEQKILKRTARLEVTNAKLEERNAKFAEELEERKRIEDEINKFNNKLENKVMERTIRTIISGRKCQV
ncbi:hypothetical protein JCM17380_07140 [Desulfosporosinus burensis]